MAALPVGQSILVYGALQSTAQIRHRPKFLLSLHMVSIPYTGVLRYDTDAIV